MTPTAETTAPVFEAPARIADLDVDLIGTLTAALVELSTDAAYRAEAATALRLGSNDRSRLVERGDVHEDCPHCYTGHPHTMRRHVEEIDIAQSEWGF